MDNPDNQAAVSRRAILGLLGVGGLGLATGQAAGQGQRGPPHYNWREDVDANGNALQGLGTLEMAGHEEEGSIGAFGDLIIDDEENEIQYFVGGRWVSTGADPVEHYPDIVADGHEWTEVRE